MRVIWSLLTKFQGAFTCNPLDFTSLELEYLAEFQDEFMQQQQELLDKSNKELDEQVGKQKEVQNKQVKSVDRFTNYLNKIDLSGKPAEYVSPLKKDR